MTVSYKGKELPFGTQARIESKDDIYYVGDMGQVYLNDAPDNGKVIFNWGENSTCSVSFTLPVTKEESLPIALLTPECH